MAGTEHAVRSAAEVSDEDSFLAFVAWLASDARDEEQKEARRPSPPGRGANGWEHETIGAYLEAAAAWGHATQAGATQSAPPSEVWRRCAAILEAGKSYE